MAVRKSTKNTQKLEANELQQLIELRQQISDLTFRRGQVALAEDTLEAQRMELKSLQHQLSQKEKTLSSELFGKYGKGEINLDEGTITLTD